MAALNKYNKLWVALSGAIAQAIAQGLIGGTSAVVASIIIGAITTAGVFAVPNEPA